MSRQDHEFEFEAGVIADAAAARAAHHEEREAYWQVEYDRAVARVRETVGAKVVEQEVSGGKRAEVVVDYGDPSAYRRMQEAYSKIASHRDAARAFRSDESVYESQRGRLYELDLADVHYFGLAT
jgi:hypothetical protein